ncbi:transcription repressor OFP12-like [Coffea eugenioides]|uniref:Transcription repressor n=1 Tax=Coffea arabica TaxID=13443 RepID=A0A6P6V1B6_COFAR|nr:transcription repressor OFP12-like [Coffea arabica]XP_027150581.1 transcription repressor OFP12-like [Coffea eugenioides]XP_027150727.1 transcription repressor OFP12-like [Coffea eugenioides]
MPSNLGRNINLCFTNITAPSSPQSSIQAEHSRSLSSSAASVLIKNFNSLYDFTFDCTTYSKSFPHPTSATTTSDDDLSSSESYTTSSTPDFSTVFASQRFFCSSPGRSNSIIDSSSSLSSTSSSSPGIPTEPDSVVGGSIAVATYSPDPFMDFRRSMQEMVEAHDLIDVAANWDYLHELLTCYLSLNPKRTHKFIVGAFADLLVSLITSSSPDDERCRCTKSKFSDDGRKMSGMGGRM